MADRSVAAKCGRGFVADASAALTSLQSSKIDALDCQGMCKSRFRLFSIEMAIPKGEIELPTQGGLKDWRMKVRRILRECCERLEEPSSTRIRHCMEACENFGQHDLASSWMLACCSAPEQHFWLSKERPRSASSHFGGRQALSPKIQHWEASKYLASRRAFDACGH